MAFFVGCSWSLQPGIAFYWNTDATNFQNKHRLPFNNNKKQERQMLSIFICRCWSCVYIARAFAFHSIWASVVHLKIRLGHQSPNWYANTLSFIYEISSFLPAILMQTASIKIKTILLRAKKQIYKWVHKKPNLGICAEGTHIKLHFEIFALKLATATFNNTINAPQPQNFLIITMWFLRISSVTGAELADWVDALKTLYSHRISIKWCGMQSANRF